MSYLKEDWAFTPAPKPELLSVKEDIFTMICTFHRIGASDFNDDIVPNIIEEDRELGATIRAFYGQKLLVMRLCNTPMTVFRTALEKLINREVHNQYYFTEFPILFKLPEFYKYDQALLELKQEFNSGSVKENSFGSSVVIADYTLHPVKHFARRLKSGMTNEYWMKDTDGALFLLCIPGTDSCLSLWTREFALSKLRIAGSVWSTKRDGLPYYKFLKWSIL